jgi:Zn-finger nucleic acid-binding protein
MICPSCKSELIILELNQIEIDYCPDCSGIWLDAGELELLSGATLHSELMKQFQIANDVKEAKRNCPICKKNLKKYYFGSTKDLLIDICSKEHGIWFDNNELIKVISSVDKGRSASITHFINDIFNYKK